MIAVFDFLSGTPKVKMTKEQDKERRRLYMKEKRVRDNQENRSVEDTIIAESKFVVVS